MNARQLHTSRGTIDSAVTVHWLLIWEMIADRGHDVPVLLDSAPQDSGGRATTAAQIHAILVQNADKYNRQATPVHTQLGNKQYPTIPPGFEEWNRLLHSAVPQNFRDMDIKITAHRVVNAWSALLQFSVQLPVFSLLKTIGPFRTVREDTAQHDRAEAVNQWNAFANQIAEVEAAARERNRQARLTQTTETKSNVQDYTILEWFKKYTVTDDASAPPQRELVNKITQKINSTARDESTSTVPPTSIDSACTARDESTSAVPPTSIDSACSVPPGSIDSACSVPPGSIDSAGSVPSGSIDSACAALLAGWILLVQSVVLRR
ncbi:hypothetical protein FN846DRAFT_909722 [Sphaerosporella brunnea]|uniref:Uncharacterized protein n=1 Tax=Sphaerosporella brunnea TaxID=1250544 RepID=A0A5J5EQ99_9PEZI|nr:hypothetical protein FN846DRAFT_909722 [Sphaerosporella brunnea]